MASELLPPRASDRGDAREVLRSPGVAGGEFDDAGQQADDLAPTGGDIAFVATGTALVLLAAGLAFLLRRRTQRS